MVLDNKHKNNLEEWLHKAYDELKINYPKFYKMDNLSKLGLIASEVVLTGRVLKDEFRAEEIAVILSNASASLDTDIKYFNSTVNLPSPALFVYTLPNIVMGEICIRHGLKGENGFFVFEKFNPEFISSYVNQVLAQGAKACLAGWIEVLGEQHNVFLYLVEERNQEVLLQHTTAQLEQLYQ
jgi:hypothetical protein